jgi:hypothetical protein
MTVMVSLLTGSTVDERELTPERCVASQRRLGKR